MNKGYKLHTLGIVKNIQLRPRKVKGSKREANTPTPFMFTAIARILYQTDHTDEANWRRERAFPNSPIIPNSKFKK